MLRAGHARARQRGEHVVSKAQGKMRGCEDVVWGCWESGQRGGKTAESQVSWGKEKASEQPKDSKEHSVNTAWEQGPSRETCRSLQIRTSIYSFTASRNNGWLINREIILEMFLMNLWWLGTMRMPVINNDSFFKNRKAYFSLTVYRFIHWVAFCSISLFFYIECSDQFQEPVPILLCVLCWLQVYRS